MKTAVKDKAGKLFWDGMWESRDTPDCVNPRVSNLGNIFTRRLHELFVKIFSGVETHGKSFLEFGCGMSTWLPYFAKEFDFKVSGIDYSEIGCEQERRILAKAGVDGEIICADFFNPPTNLLEKFDVVYSSGVAEHFIPTEDCLTAFKSLLKPGGLMITIIPNMTGVIGSLAKATNRPVYDIHVLLTAEQLKAAHEKIGLKVELTEYFLSTGFGMANAEGLDPAKLSTKIKKQILKTLERFSVATWVLEDRLFQLPATRKFAPYIVCVARKV